MESLLEELNVKCITKEEQILTCDFVKPYLKKTDTSSIF